MRWLDNRVEGIKTVWKLTEHTLGNAKVNHERQVESNQEWHAKLQEMVDAKVDRLVSKTDERVCTGMEVDETPP